MRVGEDERGLDYDVRADAVIEIGVEVKMEGVMRGAGLLKRP